MKRMLFTIAVIFLVVACKPEVRHELALETPKEPIRIDMNINIQHDVRVKVDKELDNVMAKNEDIF